ncbi:hypothetical protein Tco_1403804 [Tanacetum coccineum]
MQLQDTKGKEIAQTISHLHHESASEEDSDTEQLRRDKDMHKNLASLQENVGSPGGSASELGYSACNCRNLVHYANGMQRKPKRVRDSTYHKEKMLLCKQAEKGRSTSSKAIDWLS